MENIIKKFLQTVTANNPGETEFLQAVTEVAESIIPFITANEKYRDKQLLDRIVEPERVIIFRVPWIDDNNIIQVNRGYRVQMNSAIGPYKGGLRFHPTVNLSILKFLAFEQTFKNSLTTLPMGGGKGGANFDPKGKSDGEVMRFCQSFMSELFRYIGEDTDVPAGDIGVGEREVGYLFGMYKKLTNKFTGVLTGKGMSYGGSFIRPEATGYGLIYFVENMLAAKYESVSGKTIVISGSGNVSQYAAQKATALGGKVVTLSDSEGFIYDKDGIDEEKLNWVMQLKNVRRGRISEYADHFKSAKFYKDKKPWSVECDIALPCATQNEILVGDAQALVKSKVMCVAEGANMPSTLEAINTFQKHKILYAPGKASNAGGVATSGLEMSQNSLRYKWTHEKVDRKLHEIMNNVHAECILYGANGSKDYVDYVKGANIAGFVKVADAMLAQGVV